MIVLKEVTTTDCGSWVALWVSFIMIVVGMILLMLKFNTTIKIFIASIILMSIFTIVITRLHMIASPPLKEIECIIEDKEVLQQVCQDYDIISVKKGDIYLLRSKGVEE